MMLNVHKWTSCGNTVEKINVKRRNDRSIKWKNLFTLIGQRPIEQKILSLIQQLSFKEGLDICRWKSIRDCSWRSEECNL